MHQRMIDDKFLSQLKDGRLRHVTELVKAPASELFLAFRQNDKTGRGYVNVYYKSHSLYKIEQMARDRYKLSFDFNHARFTPGYEAVLEELRRMGFCLPHDREQIVDGEDNTLSRWIDADEPELWTQSADRFKGLIDDFFDTSKTTDQFRGEKALRRSPLTEKKHQQRLALSNQTCEGDGYYIYDIEYTEPKAAALHGRFDMLAAEVKNGRACALLLIELKSTPGTMQGNCSVAAHSRDMKAYLDSGLKDRRLEELPRILNAYRLLFGRAPDCDEATEARAAFAFTGAVKNAPAEVSEAVWRQKDDEDWTLHF